MSAYQQFLDYASESGLSPDVVFCRFTLFSECFGAVIVLIVQFLFRLFRKLKLHFQNSRKAD